MSVSFPMFILRPISFCRSSYHVPPPLVNSVDEVFREFGTRENLGMKGGAGSWHERDNRRGGCAEIKLRAERKLGEMLAEMEKHPPGPDPINRYHDVTEPPKLSDLGITKTQSSRWQLEANGAQVDRGDGTRKAALGAQGRPIADEGPRADRSPVLALKSAQVWLLRGCFT